MRLQAQANDINDKVNDKHRAFEMMTAFILNLEWRRQFGLPIYVPPALRPTALPRGEWRGPIPGVIGQTADKEADQDIKGVVDFRNSFRVSHWVTIDFSQ